MTILRAPSVLVLLCSFRQVRSSKNQFSSMGWGLPKVPELGKDTFGLAFKSTWWKRDGRKETPEEVAAATRHGPVWTGW